MVDGSHDYTDIHHAVSAIGVCEEGVIISTWGEKYILPYNNVKISQKNGWKRSTIGYSIYKIDEVEVENDNDTRLPNEISE